MEPPCIDGLKVVTEKPDSSLCLCIQGSQRTVPQMCSAPSFLSIPSLQNPLLGLAITLSSTYYIVGDPVCLPAFIHGCPQWVRPETRESWYPMADSCPGSEANKSEGRCVRRRKGHRSCGHYKGMWELKWTVKLMSAPCHFGLHQNVPPAPVQAYPHLNIGLMQM